jgi:VanZ family protein
MKRNGLTAAALAWAGLIFFLSSRPASEYATPQDWLDFIPGVDYFAHGGLFFVLAALVYGVLRTNWPRRGWLVAPDTVIFSVIYALSDEYHQTFVEGREATGFDLIADTLGAIIAVVLAVIVTRLRRKPTEDAE